MLRRLTPWLALLGLMVATILLWQTRFAAIPHPLNGDAGFEAGLDGWSKGGGKNGLSQQAGSTVARFARPARDGEFTSASRWLGSPGGLRYLHVKVEAKWNDVILNPANWKGPRLILMHKDPRERNRHRWEHWAYIANGTRDWNRHETVFKLHPEFSDVGLAFQMLAQQGKMEVRKLQITAVRLRPWAPVATALLVAAWITWLAGRLRDRKHPVSRWRVIAAATVLVASSWLLVFPGLGTQFRPLLGGLVIGSTEPSPTSTARPAKLPAEPKTTAGASSKAAPEVATPILITSSSRVPRMRVIPAEKSTQQTAGQRKGSIAPSPPPTTAKPAPAPKPQERPFTSNDLRRLNLKLDLLHLLPFFGLSLAVFLILGSQRTWPLLSAVALSSELMSCWHGRSAGADDLLDLASNLTGVALATGAFLLIARLGNRLRRWRQSAGPERG